MASPENPFDQTIWDPIDPEHAIEDPIHGPEAVARLLSTPPYRNEDGTYHVFGGLYACGTTSFDSEGRPFIRFASAGSMHQAVRDAFKHQQWIEKWSAGQLPSIEEMDYPAFQFDAAPYFVIGD